MAYRIEYAYTSHVGKIRGNNEDNFWCCGDYLKADNKGTGEVRSRSADQDELPLLAVFDGMGGECCGEIAAYLAADACGKHYQTEGAYVPGEMESFLVESCKSMNKSVCDYAMENRIRSMGTTVAMLGFDQKEILSCNLGDSRIYQSYPGSLIQISTDHVLKSVTFGKAPLTQYVGIPEENMTLEPAIMKMEAIPGIRYLLCSDGVTDMLSEQELRDILEKEAPVKETVEALLERTLENGGKDNATIILCEIQEPTIKSRVRQWFDRQKKKK
ncbi:MAG TPA: protein phosphatase 2C domain-containing protein [Candidatus Blautia faecavium]|uniref:Protein phosphatase 2C domain-containing protein n=1 Tax=Candidatus Blautia faecavium TaxID=2838487 RepID=A0A9D2LQV0_9FIRM|nr:protein phosphatase 2C domain-containing protein [Candidatus Blautia faecavium]